VNVGESSLLTWQLKKEMGTLSDVEEIGVSSVSVTFCKLLIYRELINVHFPDCGIDLWLDGGIASKEPAAIALLEIYGYVPQRVVRYCFRLNPEITCNYTILIKNMISKYRQLRLSNNDMRTQYSSHYQYMRGSAIQVHLVLLQFGRGDSSFDSLVNIFHCTNGNCYACHQDACGKEINSSYPKLL